MKKIILLCILLMSCNVYAENIAEAIFQEPIIAAYYPYDADYVLFPGAGSAMGFIVVQADDKTHLQGRYYVVDKNGQRYRVLSEEDFDIKNNNRDGKLDSQDPEYKNLFLAKFDDISGKTITIEKKLPPEFIYLPPNANVKFYRKRDIFKALQE